MSCEAEARKRVIYRVTFVGFVVNLVLTAMKFAAGIVGRSGAMVADAVHSCSDMATDVVVIAFAKISAKPRDDGHDYGHGKYETLATIIISLALAAVGAGILLSSIRAIRIVVDGGELPRPGAVALAAAVVSIVIKEILYRYTVREGRRVESPSMVANAWHHRQRRPFGRWGRWRASDVPISSGSGGASPIPSQRWSSQSLSSRLLST